MSKQADLYANAGEQFAASLARLARAVERDADKARDLEQEIHAALWASFARFEGQCALKTWVYRVAHNVAADHVSKAVRGPKRVALEEIDELPSPSNPERAAGESLVLAQVRDLIRQLPFPDSQVMLLWLEGETTKAIAEVTGLTPSAVGVRVHRIKALMTAHFDTPALQGASS
ncbi:MAG: sigma-70 family RNA polymerase sigma factor [Pseudomonadota bacterium]